MVLNSEEYNQSYFDGDAGRYRHNAGYSYYSRCYRTDGPTSTGEKWRDFAAGLAARFNLYGKRVLELGCAKGFVVEDLRSLNVDAWGVDISAYAIGCAAERVRPCLHIADALTYLQGLKNDAYDFMFSHGFLECIASLRPLVLQMNRTARSQTHFTHSQLNEKYYVKRSVEELAALPWKPGTRLIVLEQSKEIAI